VRPRAARLIVLRTGELGKGTRPRIVGIVRFAAVRPFNYVPFSTVSTAPLMVEPGDADESSMPADALSTKAHTTALTWARVPFLVAHRAGNHLELLRAAEAEHRGAVVETDVNLFRGRLEVRHLKTLGPLPLFWDRWEFAPPWRPRLLLSELLAAAAPETELMLDLKGQDPRLAERVIETLEPYLGERRVTICTRAWPLLESFEGLPVRRIHSVGTAKQLRALIRGSSTRRIEGVSIHERLLDLAAVTELRRVAGVVMTWPVNDLPRATELVRLGVDGLISDRPSVISGLAAPEAAA
jgi:glycerophosphoryl diester phosphodiesterase